MRYNCQNRYTVPKKYLYKVEKFSGIDGVEREKLPFNYASYGYNVRFSAGEIKEGNGIEYAKIGNRYIPGTGTTGEGIQRLFLYKRFDRSTGIRDDRLIVYSDGEKLYQADLATARSFSQINVTLGTDNLTFLNCEYNGQDVLWICDDRGHLVIYDGTNVQTMSDTPYFSDACVYNGRVYATSGSGNNVLRFSAENDPTEWRESEGAGKVQFPDDGGKILRCVVYKESLIIFREYGVYKYVRYPGSSTYTLTKVFCTEQPIYPKSVCVCDGRLIFLSGKGFYALDGSVVTAIWKNLFPLIESAKNCSAACFDNRYYLTFSMKKDGTQVGEENAYFVNNAFLVVDADGKEYGITRGADVAEFIPVEYKGETELFCRFTHSYHTFDIGMVGNSGKVFSTSLKKVWYHPVSLCASAGEKVILKKIFLRSSGEITVKVKTDVEQEFSIPAAGRNHCIVIGRKGDAVGLTLTSTADKITVTDMEMEFDKSNRGVYDE